MKIKKKRIKEEKKNLRNKFKKTRILREKATILKKAKKTRRLSAQFIWKTMKRIEYNV